MVEVITEKKDKKVLWLLLALVILLCAAFLLFLFSKGLVLGATVSAWWRCGLPARLSSVPISPLPFPSRWLPRREGREDHRPAAGAVHPGGPRKIPVGLPEGTAFPPGNAFPAFHFLQCRG